MKVLIAFLVIVCFSSVGFSQITNESKIIESYGQEWYDRVENQTPSLLVLMDKYISHGFQVLTVDEGKYLEFEPLEFIAKSNEEGQTVTVNEFLQDAASPNFNPLNYSFFPSKDHQIYKLKGVNKIIYILPQGEILSK